MGPTVAAVACRCWGKARDCLRKVQPVRSRTRGVLTAIVTVEDPDTFNGPLTLKNIWRRNNVAIEESVCADDDGKDVYNFNLHPIPVADKPDF